MPPTRKNAKATRRRSSEESNGPLDVKYQPMILEQLLTDLDTHTKAKCQAIYKDMEFLITSMQQAFHLELIKLPSQVKKMTMKQFEEQFQCSVEAVTRNAMLGVGINKPSNVNSTGSSSSYTLNNQTVQSHSVLETPASYRSKLMLNLTTPMGPPKTTKRAPREGENILSENGSPLGEFSTTVKKPLKQGGVLGLPPATPKVLVPLRSGTVLDVEDVDVDSMPVEQKHEALQQMELMMQNMKAMMERLQGGPTTF